MAAVQCEDRGRETTDKERLMRQERRRRRRGRQVQRTPGAITVAWQKRRQEIKVVVATWCYRLSAAISKLTSASRWKWCCAGFQERRRGGGGRGRRWKGGDEGGRAGEGKVVGGEEEQEEEERDSAE